MANGFSSSSQVQTRREISRSATTYRVEWEDVKKKKKGKKKKRQKEKVYRNKGALPPAGAARQLIHLR